MSNDARTSLETLYQPGYSSDYDVITHARGPQGRLPFTREMLLESPSGDIFRLSQNVGMGWDPMKLTGKEFLIMSTMGGMRDPNGDPIALGYHTGHWEVGLLVEACARTLKDLGHIPYAAYCSDPCDGRSQGTTGMFDSLAYRNDATVVLRRLARSLPTRKGLVGVATCDKGLPAMMIALAGLKSLPSVVVPGGVTLPPTHGEDAGRIQSVGARYAHAVRHHLVADHRMSARLGRVLAHRRGARGAIALLDHAGGWSRRNFARWMFEDEPRAIALTPSRWHRRILAGAGAFAS